MRNAQSEISASEAAPQTGHNHEWTLGDTNVFTRGSALECGGLTALCAFGGSTSMTVAVA
ncbi:MAG: hypothetical protein DME90_12305 [Verrucomicrobia bacterium]|nr:MAG: hypothetical protein DME90_12305 [Verrucomicrobiota bacterium]